VYLKYVKNEFYDLELFGWSHKSGEDKTPYQKPIPIVARLLLRRSLAVTVRSIVIARSEATKQSQKRSPRAP